MVNLNLKIQDNTCLWTLNSSPVDHMATNGDQEQHSIHIYTYAWYGVPNTACFWSVKGDQEEMHTQSYNKTGFL